MDAAMISLISSDSTNIVSALANASGPVLMAFVLWSGVIKSPPLWVTWREHLVCKTDSGKWEALALKGTYVASVATDAVEQERSA